MSDDNLDLLTRHARRARAQGAHLGPAARLRRRGWIEDATGGTLQVEEGALYHALHRLEKQAWVASEWGVSETNRRAKYYTLTAAGRRQLAARPRPGRATPRPSSPRCAPPDGRSPCSCQHGIRRAFRLALEPPPIEARSGRRGRVPPRDARHRATWRAAWSAEAARAEALARFGDSHQRGAWQ